LQTAA